MKDENVIHVFNSKNELLFSESRKRIINEKCGTTYKTLTARLNSGDSFQGRYYFSHDPNFKIVLKAFPKAKKSKKEKEPKTIKIKKELGNNFQEEMYRLKQLAKDSAATIGKRKKAVFIPAKVAVRQSILREFPNQKYL